MSTLNILQLVLIYFGGWDFSLNRSSGLAWKTAGPTPDFPNLGVTGTVCRVAYMSTGDLNSGPCACMATTLTTDFPSHIFTRLFSPYQTMAFMSSSS